MVVLFDRDIPGGSNNRSKVQERDDWSECAYTCAQDAVCASFTYVPPGIQGTKAVCWLKDNVPSSVAHTGFVSGRIAKD